MRRDFSIKNLLRNVLFVLVLYAVLFVLIKANIINLSDNTQVRLNYVFLFVIIYEVIIVAIYNWFKK